MPLADFQSLKVVNQEVSSSTKFNNLVQGAQDGINSIDNSKILSSAAIDISKLAGFPNDIKKGLRGDGSWVEEGRVYDRATSLITLTNSTTETSLFTKTITANHLGTDRMIRLLLLGDMVYNLNNNLTIRVKLGATTLIAATAGTATISSSGIPWRMWVDLMNLGATNSQWCDAKMEFPVPGSTITTGAGGFSIAGGAIGSNGLHAGNSGALDTTQNQDLVVTAQWASASASSQIRRIAALAVLL